MFYLDKQQEAVNLLEAMVDSDADFWTETHVAEFLGLDIGNFEQRKIVYSIADYLIDKKLLIPQEGDDKHAYILAEREKKYKFN